VSVLNQAINAAGGMQAISAIKDYTATGSVILHEATDVQGSVTVMGLGLNSFRQDTTLLAGGRTQIMTDGGVRTKFENGTIRNSYRDASWYPGALALPYLLILRGLASPAYSLTYKGLINIDGQSAHDIRLQMLHANHPQGAPNDFFTRDFFIDASTFQVIMTQDPDHRHHLLLRQVRYSDFRPINGVLAPFAFSESSRGHENWELKLNQINFNTGIDTSAFTPTGIGIK
jgi:hypothetical protein